MVSLLRRLRRKPPAAARRIVADEETISVIRADTGADLWRIRWADVREVATWKVDCAYYDLICVGFRTEGSPQFHQFHEEFSGWHGLLDVVDAHCGLDQEVWLRRVAIPAFRRNWTCLWLREGEASRWTPPDVVRPRSGIPRWRLALAVGSLLACVAVLGLWAQSYAAPGVRVHQGDRVVFGGASIQGRLGIGGTLPRPEFNRLDQYFLDAVLRSPENSGGYAFGFGYRLLLIPAPASTYDWSKLSPYRIASVPHWFIAIVTGLPAAMGLRAARRHRRRVSGGLCLACGYDLRESRERCPECGTAVAVR